MSTRASEREAFVAATRFGLGPRPGEVARTPSDVRRALLDQLSRKDAAEIQDPGLEPSWVVHVAANQAVIEQRLVRAFGAQGADRLAKAGPAAPGGAAPGGGAAEGMESAAPMTGAPEPGQMSPSAAKAVADRPQVIRRQAFRAEMAARMEHARTTDHGLVERLVMFWSNHFCVSADKGAVLGLAGAFEREAIRPHVLGRFSDMLLAVEQHPAMLIYLDNQASTGPNSRIGRSRERGINENLAREILELHTLGVDGGYTQADVTNLAKVITGWMVGHTGQPRAEPGKFFFSAQRHEPGQHQVLGRRYGNEGVTAGERCLADLARHPSTARHLARKLAAHFVSETPPPALVARLETAFRDSGGDLAVVARALVTSEEAWTAPPAKVLPPYDFIVACQRGFGLAAIAPLERNRLMTTLGQSLWRPPSPKGWPDGNETWSAPSALRERLRIAERFAETIVQSGRDPREMASELLGPALSEHTREAIARAEAREQAIALLIMSPEMQRR